MFERARYEIGINFLDEQPRQRRSAAAQTRNLPNRFTKNGRKCVAFIHIFIVAYICKISYNEGMFVVGICSWWYSTGWKMMIVRVRESLLDVYDYFSLGLLLKTLFAPWRQISAGRVRGPLSVQLRAFFDRLVSRIIGGFIRTFVLIIGSIVVSAAAVIGLAKILVWPLVPIFPVAAVFCAMAGWIPWHL